MQNNNNNDLEVASHHIKSDSKKLKLEKSIKNDKLKILKHFCLFPPDYLKLMVDEIKLMKFKHDEKSQISSKFGK